MPRTTVWVGALLSVVDETAAPLVQQLRGKYRYSVLSYIDDFLLAPSRIRVIVRKETVPGHVGSWKRCSVGCY